MILRELASNQPSTLIAVPIVVIGVLAPSIWLEAPYIIQLNFPADALFQSFYTNKLFSVITAIALLIVGSLFVNTVFNRHEFYSIPAFTSSFLYAMVGGALSLYQLSIPALLGGLFFLAGINRQLAIYRQTRVNAECFEAGFWFGLAALVFPPYFILIAGSWVALIYARAFSLREHFLLLLAFSVPFLYWVVWKYWNDDLADLILFKRIVSYDRMNILPNSNWPAKFLMATLAGAFVLALPRFVFFSDRSSNKSAGVKKVFSILSLSVAIAFVLGYYLTQSWVFLALLAPLCIILGFWFANYRYSLAAPFVFYAIVVLSLLVVLKHYTVLPSFFGS